MMMKICNVFIALLAAAPLAEAQVYANVDSCYTRYRDRRCSQDNGGPVQVFDGKSSDITPAEW